jgi:hypothetical protein
MLREDAPDGVAGVSCRDGKVERVMGIEPT